MVYLTSKKDFNRQAQNLTELCLFLQYTQLKFFKELLISFNGQRDSPNKSNTAI